MKVGLRTGEICSLRVENINFEDKTFYVVDSKRKKLYPLPLDVLTLQLIQDLIGPRREGYVFTREVYSRSWSHAKTGKPLCVATVEARLKKIAEATGVKGFTPRLLRHYFAVEWLRAGKNLELLRQILRHKSLAYTQFYLSRLVYFEDLQSEYESIQMGPLSPSWQDKTENLTPAICRKCEKLPICKLADKMPSWVTGCQYFSPEQKPSVQPGISNSLP
jgi:integrase